VVPFARLEANPGFALGGGRPGGAGEKGFLKIGVGRGGGTWGIGFPARGWGGGTGDGSGGYPGRRGALGLNGGIFTGTERGGPVVPAVGETKRPPQKGALYYFSRSLGWVFFSVPPQGGEGGGPGRLEGGHPEVGGIGRRFLAGKRDGRGGGGTGRGNRILSPTPKNSINGQGEGGAKTGPRWGPPLLGAGKKGTGSQPFGIETKQLDFFIPRAPPGGGSGGRGGRGQGPPGTPQKGRPPKHRGRHGGGGPHSGG